MISTRIAKMGFPMQVGRRRVGAYSSLFLILGLVTMFNGAQSDTKASSDRNYMRRLANLGSHPLYEKAKAVCNNQRTKINKISDMSTIIFIVNVLGLCIQRYMPALNELDPLLKLDRRQMCSDAAFKLFENYHFRFIQPKRQANKKPTQYEPAPMEIVKAQLFAAPDKYTVDFDNNGQPMIAPIAARHFFLKLGLQISYTCKMNLLSNLFADSNRILTDDDRAIMDMFDDRRPIGEALLSGTVQLDFDSVLYIPELDGKLDGVAGARAEDRHKLFTQDNPDESPVTEDGYHPRLMKTTASEDSSLFQTIFSCKNRFRPLYESLIIPVVRLSKMGYDYQGSKFSGPDEKQLASREMKHWLAIVHVCDIFRNVQLVTVDEERKSVENLTPYPPMDPKREGTLVEVHDKNQIEELQNVPEENKYKCLQPIEYSPTILNSVEDELMIYYEKELDLELSRKRGSMNPFGFRGFLRRVAGAIKKALAKLDLERFAHYRRHSLWYAGIFNFISSLSNVGTIIITIYSIASLG